MRARFLRVRSQAGFSSHTACFFSERTGLLVKVQQFCTREKWFLLNIPRSLSTSSHEQKDVNCMASQKVLDLLLSGKTQWNMWRQAYPDVQALEPDLHAADLHGVDLQGVDLHAA